MNIGIIAEYNPFHCGHANQLTALKKQYPNATITIAMSGAFVQRGTPAICAKWQRAKWAVQHGADLVIELPVLSVLRSAEHFAKGGIALLQNLPITHLACGAENPDEQRLNRLAKPIDHTDLAPYLSTGIPYGQARTNYLSKHYPDDTELLQHPNNLLAMTYLRTLTELNSHITPILLARQTANTHPVSGSQIRQQISAQQLPTEMLPKIVAHDLTTMIPQQIAQPQYYERIVLTALRTTFHINTPYGQFSEGLENRFMKYRNATSLDEFYQQVKTKRYPLARIRRTLAQWLLAIPRQALLHHTLPTNYWIRPLAFNEIGGKLLRQSTVPVITRLRNDRETLSPQAQTALQYDLTATEIAHMTHPTLPSGGLDYYTSPQYIKRTTD